MRIPKPAALPHGTLLHVEAELDEITRYCGRAIYMGETTGRPGRWPPVVAEDVWDAVNIRVTDPRRRNQIGTDRKHLGSGLYLCGVCPDPVVSHTSVGSGIRYRCRASAHFTRSAALIDQYVLLQLRARLAMDDVASLLTTSDSPEAEAAAKEIRRLRDVITKTEHDYDNDLIDGRRYKIKTEKAKVQLAAAEAVQRRLADPSGVAEVLGADDPVVAFDAASLGQQRAVLAFFMTVRLHPAPRGRKGLDPATVQIEWNH